MARVHVIAEGECLSSVAFENGYFPGTIWERPENDALRELRGDPNVLLPGDRLFVPDKEPKTTACATGKTHRFTRRGVPARFRLQILNADKPRPNVAYRLLLDGTIELSGSTTAEGMIDVPIPPNARRGTLFLDEDGAEYELTFGGLAPITEERGVRERLINLGYLREGDASAADLGAALKLFQRRVDLDPTGDLDEVTAEKLLHGHDVKQ